MEAPRLEVEWGCSCQAITAATATQDPSCIFDLHLILGQSQILNPVSEAWDPTRVLMDTSWVNYP